MSTPFDVRLQQSARLFLSCLIYLWINLWDRMIYRCSVVGIHRNSHRIFITADLCVLMTSRIMPIWRGYFVICSSEKVCHEPGLWLIMMMLIHTRRHFDAIHLKRSIDSSKVFGISVVRSSVSSNFFSFFFPSGFQFDYVFDWTILKYQQSQMTNKPSRSPVSVPLHGHAQQASLTARVLDHSSPLLFKVIDGAGQSSGLTPAVANAERQPGNFSTTSLFCFILWIHYELKNPFFFFFRLVPKIESSTMKF